MTVTMQADVCQLCASNGRQTFKFTPAEGALAICPLCDRRSCGVCKTPIYDGNAQRCGSCGRSVALR